MGEWIDRGFAYKASPDFSGKVPGVLILMEAYGLNAHFRKLTERFASWGMVALTPDLYHRLPQERRVVSYSDRETALNNLSRLTDADAKEDIGRALRFLKEDPFVNETRIAVVGFCMGGRLSFLASEWFGKEIHCAVSLYGGAIGLPRGHYPGQTENPLSGTALIEASLLLLYGEADSNISGEERAAVSKSLEEAGKTFKMITYPEAGHGFFCEDRPSYHQKSANAAEKEMKTFFSSCLGIRV